MELLQLHDAPDYMKECADVLNEEWKRSLNARLHSLEKSKDTFPVCLVLLEEDDSGKMRVVGHSRLSNIRGQVDKSCLIESVVVKKSHRGKGYGRIIMEKSEDYAVSKGYKTMYLTTHDKQDFYQHLGYQFCKPVVSLGADILPDHLAEKLFGKMNLNTAQEPVKELGKPEDVHKADSKKCRENKESVETCKADNKPHSVQTPLSGIQTTHSDVQTPPFHVQAPPPPPPPPMAKKPKSEETSDTVVRWDPSKVAWMKKSLS